jgi:Fe2+ transport system protein FeoA
MPGQLHKLVLMDPKSTSITLLPSGTSALLQAIEGEPVIVERLGELGFVPGETLVLQRRLVFNGPLIVEVRGVPVALRAEEASCLRVLARAAP